MIDKLQLLRNIGQFESVSTGADIPLTRLTLVYSENGRGKTTLAAVLRSLATGDPIPIAERRRLASQNPPHVVLGCSGGPPPAIFENNAWNRTLPNMVVFDDVFIDQNVCSGLAVESHHRQKLHEFILGAQAVALNQRLQQLVEQIETHNSELRTKAAAIPATQRGLLSVDEFCALPSRTDIGGVIQVAERNLAAAREQDAIRDTAPFDTLNLPAFDLIAIEQVLQQDLPSLDAAASTQVQAHLARLGKGGEAWAGDGMRRIPQEAGGATTATCPFCAQDLQGSPIIHHYRAYFSEAYASLKRTVSDALGAVNRTHGGDAPAEFERAVRVAVERRQFWSRFCEILEFTLDTATIVRDWRAAREAVIEQFAAKQAAPLERMRPSEETKALMAIYRGHGEMIATLNQRFQEGIQAISVVKERAATANSTVLAVDLVRLRAVRDRHTPATAALCDEYLRERAAKAETERLREQAKAELDRHRTTVFPGYQTAINLYLQRFNAGFRLDSVTSTDTRGGPTCTYNVIINDTPVPVSGGEPTSGEPSFRNTLSSGDRNTLALAFFFASLDQDHALRGKVVVIDDPVSSLDDHRSWATVQEIRRLADRAGQVIVLSHKKAFLCRVWDGADRTARTALDVARDAQGSTIRLWDVNQDSITEHDRRHAMLSTYLSQGTGNQREVAAAIRHLLEAFLRVAYPRHFPPGTQLGSFRVRCEQQLATADEILNAQDTQELADLIEYANKFHHDINAAWETEPINDGELRGFVQRALRFARR